MELDFKARVFLMEALEYRIEWFEQELRRDDLTDDDLSDLRNDRCYLHSLLADIRRLHRSPDEATER